MFSAFILTVISSLLIVYYVRNKLCSRSSEELFTKFDGPRAYPIVGHAHHFLRSSTDILKWSTDLTSRYKSPILLWAVQIPIILVFDPETFKIVLNNVLRKGATFSFLKNVFGNGLISIDDQSQWKKHRRIVNPAFSGKLTDRYYLDVFNQLNNKLARELNTFADTGRTINLWRYIFKWESRTICKSVLDCNIEDEEQKAFSQFSLAMKKATQLMIRRMFQPWLYSEKMFNLYNQISGANKIFEGVREFPRKMIADRRAQNEHIDKSKAKSTPLFIDILSSQETSEVYEEGELEDEITTILDAGSGSTVTTICFALLMLAMHQEIQERVYEEICNTIGTEDTAIELEKLNQLTFLEQCIKETLRLFAAVPFILRSNSEDFKLKDDKIIPAGTTIILSIFHLHRDIAIYPNPEVWDPNRFTPEEIAKRPEYSFVPFSGGPRTCIGYRYAALNIKSQVATLLRKFQFSTDLKMSDIKLAFDIVLRNLSGYHVYIERRKEMPA